MDKGSIADLAESWSELLVANIHHSEQPVAPVSETGSVLRPGASESDIESTEARLGVRLPEDYRAFLLRSDGAFADWGGAITERELFARSEMPEPGIGLLPVAAVRRIADVEPEWTEMWVEGDQGIEPDPMPNWSEVMDMRPLAIGLLISSLAEQFRMVLVPVQDRWEVWDFFKEGATRHISFEAWLRFRIASLQPPVTTPDDFRALLDRAAAGDGRARLDSLKVRAPDVEPVVIEALRDPARIGFVIAIVERWPSDEVVDALDAAVRAVDDSDPLAAFGIRHQIFTRLMLIGTQHAEDVLRTHGATLQADMALRKRGASDEA